MPNIYAIRFELRLNALLFIDLRTKLHIASFWVTIKLFRKSLFTSFSSSKMFLKNIYTKWLFKNVRNAESFETFFFFKGAQFESEVLFFFIKINGIENRYIFFYRKIKSWLKFRKMHFDRFEKDSF